MDTRKVMEWLAFLLLLTEYSVALQWYNSGTQTAKIGSNIDLQWRYKLAASEQQSAQDFSMLLWERETTLNSDEWVTVAALHPSTGKKINTDSRIVLGSNLTLHISNVESIYFSRFRCTFISSFASSSSNLILKDEVHRKDVRVRLVDGSSPNQGRVEVFYQGAWGTVCHNAWNERDAIVVCGMLGYPLGFPYCCSSYGRGSDTIWLDKVSCQGNESSIVDCQHSEWGINNCTHESDAGVYCYGPTPARPSTKPVLTTTSAPSFRVRLANGSTSNQGRVEVLYGGTWGTICHNHWDSRNAKVVCNMLGYPLGYPYCCGHYGPGSGPIWMDKVYCGGAEESLSTCSHAGWANNTCDHSMDVGVYCYFPLPPAPSTTAPPKPPTTAPGFQVRLENGQSPNQGRVEVYHEGSWGTVCDTNWDSADAMVTCRMLGYASGFPYCCGAYGNGTGPVWIDNVACVGNETSLASCGHGGWSNNKCSHSSDAGVYCLVPPRPPVPTVPTEPTTVITTPTRCPPQPTVHDTSGINCTFDGGLCGWTAIDPFQPGMLKWTRHSGVTPTEYTGPDGDHTSGCGSYMYMEATGYNQSNSAFLASPVLPGNGKPSCFSFYYHMNGSGMGRMAVAAGSNIVWQIAGSRGSHWNLVSFTLNSTVPYQLYLIGAIGSNDKSDIAVDDISFVSGSSCQNEVSSNATTAPPVFSGHCSFDTNMCGWTNVQGDQFDWTRNQGSTPTNGTGPSGDHTSGSGWYMYLEASAPRLEGDIARLVSPVLKAGNSCLTFFYHMFDLEKDLDKVRFGELKVKVGGKSVWQASGNHGNSWYRGMASIKSENPFQVTLEGVRGSNAWSDIAVDDIKILEDTQCPLEANCTFENGFCGWTNEEGDKLDWGRNYGPTLSKDTGPSFDHTTQTQTGHYIFIETSNRSPGDIARLVSQELDQTTKCMSFYYHMYGATVSTLSIKVGGLKVWTISGNQGNYWYKATLPLEFVRPFKVTIEGSVGSSYTGDIAVDDVMFSNYECNLTASSKIPARVIRVSNDQTVKDGERVELECIVSGSFAVPTHVAWAREGGRVVQNDTVKRNYTISSVKIEDAGVYICMATNAYGKDQKKTSIEVQYAPRDIVFTTNAPHNVAAPGERVDITCLTKGNPKPSCTLWIKKPDGSMHEVSNSLPGVHVIPSYSTSQHYGAYLCSCSNHISRENRFLVLSTYAKPKIAAILPVSQTVNETEPIHLFCNATGNPPSNITWSKVGDPSRAFPSGSSLTLTESSKADSGAFQCKADNGRGSDTGLATVSFKYTVPVIMAAPQNVTAYEHEKSSVTFTCNATGEPVPSIIWKKDNTTTILSRGEQLVLPNVTRKDQGLYICVANNGIGTNVSANAMLQVLYKPSSTTLETDNVNPVVIGNGKITLICKSNANPQVHNYSFYLDDICVGRSDTGELTISPAKKSDQGRYRCQPENKVGVGETAELYLTVYEPLEIVTQPQSQTVEEGNSISLFCNASSSLPAKVFWEKEGKTLFVGNTLSITRVSRSDAGIYKCIAKNGVAFPITATAETNVIYKPESTKVMVKTNTGVVRLYETVDVTCSADANPPPNSFSFYLNDSIIQSGPTNVYTIKNFNTSDVGVYSCVPSNTVGVGQKASTDIAIGGEVKGNFTKCYKVNITAFYNIPGGVVLRSSHTLTIVFTLLRLVVLSLRSSSTCAGARISGYRQYHAPPGIDDVYVGLELEISAKDTVPSEEIASSISSCIAYLTTLKPQMTETVPNMTVDGSVYYRHNISISEKRSCCGASAPPCCTTPGVQLSISQCVFPFKVRLVNGSSPNEGRVEVFRQGVWGTVCGSNWDINDAHVVCRMLGFTSARAASCCSVHGSGVGQIWLRNVSCNGNEASLADCPHGGWGGGTCYHGQDASVVCSTDRLNITSTTQTPDTTAASTNAPAQNMSGSPAIIQRPHDVTVNQSEDVSFICKATGVPTPNITWTKVGESKVYAQGETLTILKVGRGDRGTYRCEASNGNGERALAFAVLTVKNSPCDTRLQTDNVNPVVLGNGRITLLCTADAYPSPQYSFYKEGHLLVTSSSGRFVIPKAKASDEGSYRCVATNILGRDESATITLKVYAPLSLDNRPVDTIVDEGSTASIYCNATSPLPVRIVWESLGVNTRVLPPGETLLLSNVARSDEGTYRCVAKNGLAYEDSATVSVTVRYKPQNTRLAAIPDDVVTVNRSVNLKCSTEAYPIATSFKFYHGQKLLQQSSSQVYHIATMTEAQNGSYSCVAVNVLGEGRSDTVLITIGVPCGVRHLSPSTKPKIVGGKAADPGAYPWQAQISHKLYGHICGGTILTSRFIVTAAHCFPPSRGSNYTITLGEHSLSTRDGHEQKIEVEKIIRHRNYTYIVNEHDHDIALAKLKTPIKFDGLRAAPACIPESNFTVGTSCTISGWGSLTYKGSFPDILQEAKVKLVSQEYCQAAYSVEEITPRMLCAGGDGVTDTCQGDSGGPLVCERDHKFYLTGVTSWGFGCATKGKPGVYTNTMVFRQWIEENISNNL